MNAAGRTGSVLLVRSARIAVHARVVAMVTRLPRGPLVAVALLPGTLLLALATAILLLSLAALSLRAALLALVAALLLLLALTALALRATLLADLAVVLALAFVAVSLSHETLRYAPAKVPSPLPPEGNSSA